MSSARADITGAGAALSGIASYLAVLLGAPQPKLAERFARLERQRVPARRLEAKAFEIRQREGEGSWATTAAGHGGVARLEALGCELPVDELYSEAAPPV